MRETFVIPKIACEDHQVSPLEDDLRAIVAHLEEKRSDPYRGLTANEWATLRHIQCLLNNEKERFRDVR